MRGGQRPLRDDLAVGDQRSLGERRQLDGNDGGLWRIDDGGALAGVAHAAIDVSDGLAHDAWQLAEASGVRLVLDLASVLAAGGDALAAGAAALGDDPTEHALHGGEDYALLVASPRALPGFAWIGAVEVHDDGARVRMRTTQGTVVAVEPRGFDHFT